MSVRVDNSSRYIISREIPVSYKKVVFEKIFECGQTEGFMFMPTEKVQASLRRLARTFAVRKVNLEAQKKRATSRSGEWLRMRTLKDQNKNTL